MNYINSSLTQFGFGGKWIFVDYEGKYFGKSKEETKQICDDADLFINLSGGSWFWRDEYREILRKIFIDSDPAFTQAASYATSASFPTGSLPSSITTADFNGDGKIDWATANFASNNVSIFLGSGAGGILSSATMNAGTNPTAIAADFNGDGKADLAVVNVGSDSVSILLKDGTGNFGAATNFFVGANPSAIVVSDFNGDGIKDLAVANFVFDNNGFNVTILTGLSNGRFITARSEYADTNTPAIVAGDFNGDGKTDFAVANAASYDVSVFYNNDAGGFALPVFYDVGFAPSAIVASDLNGAGKPDLAVTNSDLNNVSILRNLGNSFNPSVNYGTGACPGSLVATDVNLNGLLDLVVTDGNTNSVSLLTG